MWAILILTTSVSRQCGSYQHRDKSEINKNKPQINQLTCVTTQNYLTRSTRVNDASFHFLNRHEYLCAKKRKKCIHHSFEITVVLKKSTQQ